MYCRSVHVFSSFLLSKRSPSQRFLPYCEYEALKTGPSSSSAAREEEEEEEDDDDDGLARSEAKLRPPSGGSPSATASNAGSPASSMRVGMMLTISTNAFVRAPLDAAW